MTIRERALSSQYTRLDATSLRRLDPDHPLGITTCALWLVEGDHTYACFLYARSGHATHIEELFKGRTLATVMCDGSLTNNCVERDAGGRRGLEPPRRVARGARRALRQRERARRCGAGHLGRSAPR